MLRGKRIWELALVGGLLWTCAANATTICELDVEAPITNTGVCAQVITTLGGIVVEDLDESTSEASASAQQGVDPPAAGSQGASGTAGGTFPDPDGTGGSVSAEAFVSGDGTLGEIMSAASSFFIGEFIADDGVDGSSDPFDLTVNLDITGELFVEGPAFAILTVGVAAVDSDGNPLVDGSDFPGGVAVLFPGGFIPLGFTDLTGFTQSGTCPDPCTVTVDATESIVLDGLVDDDVFGLFLTVVALAILPEGGLGAAHANFGETIDIRFVGGNVTPILPNPAPEPASFALVLAGLLALGFGRRRRAV